MYNYTIQPKSENCHKFLNSFGRDVDSNIYELFMDKMVPPGNGPIYEIFRF